MRMTKGQPMDERDSVTTVYISYKGSFEFQWRESSTFWQLSFSLL